MFFICSSSVKKSPGYGNSVNKDENSRYMQSNFTKAAEAQVLMWKFINFSSDAIDDEASISRSLRSNTPNKSPGNVLKNISQKEKIPIKHKNLNEKKKGCGNFCTIQ